MSSSGTLGPGDYGLPAPVIPDMFARMEQMQSIRNLANQNQMFQLTLQAKQKAGQIMAAAPDEETGIKNILADPTAAPFAADFINTIRQAGMFKAQSNQINAGTYRDSYNQFVHAVASGATEDPDGWQQTVKGAVGAMTPDTRAYLASTGALENVTRAVTDELPNNPNLSPAQNTQLKQLEMRKRLNALLNGSDMKPESIQQIIGRNEMLNTGGTQQPVHIDPVTGAVQFAPTTDETGNLLTNSQGQPSGIPMTLPPTVVTGPYGARGAQTTQVIGGQPSAGASAPGDTNALGATAPLLTGPTQSQAQYNTKRADDIADYTKNLDDRVQSEGTLGRNMGEGIAAASQAQTGGGAETYMKLGQALQAIGVKTDTVDKWANGSLVGSQVIDKLALQNSMAQLKAQLTGVGGSRLNAQEFVAYLNKNPNLTTDPRAAAVIFNIWNKFYDRDKAEQVAFDKFESGQPTGDKGLDKLTKGKDLTSWPALWNQSDYMANFAPGGEIDVSKMKGIPTPAHPKAIQSILDKYPGSTP